MITIKITFEDGIAGSTRINGTRREIAQFYSQNNFMAWGSKDPLILQVTKIESADFTINFVKDHDGLYRVPMESALRREIRDCVLDWADANNIELDNDTLDRMVDEREATLIDGIHNCYTHCKE